jgi:hypothetical protein
MRTKNEGRYVARGFRLRECVSERIDWLKFNKVAKTFSDVVDVAVGDLYKKHSGPNDTGTQTVSR